MAYWDNGINSFSSASNGLVSHFYSYERSNNNRKICTSGSLCNDTVTRTTTWKGKIGLMYPSDYGYATSGGSTSNRTSCLAKELYNWSDNSYSDCKNNDWFYDSNNTFDWNLSPRTGDIDSSASFRLDYHGDIQTSYTYNMRKVHPTIYLISSTTITDGLGTKENPYVLGI